MNNHIIKTKGTEPEEAARLIREQYRRAHSGREAQSDLTAITWADNCGKLLPNEASRLLVWADPTK